MIKILSFLFGDPKVSINTDPLPYVFAFIFISLSSCAGSSECEISLDKSDWDYIERVNQLVNDKNYGEALKLNDQAIVYNPKNYIALSNRGVLQFQIKGQSLSKRELSGILDDFESSIQLCPEYLEANTNMITVASEFQLSNQVIAYALKRDSMKELTPYHLTKLLIGYYHGGYYEYAIKAGESVLRSNPTYTEAANYLGMTYMKLNDYEKAKDIFEEIIRNGRGNSLTYRGLGLWSEKIGNVLEAKNNYNLSIRRDSTQFQSYLSLASIYESQDSQALACKIYRSVDKKCGNLFMYRYSQEEVQQKIDEYCLQK